MPAHAADPFINAATRWRRRRRLLEPWLLGLGGFSLTATAGLLLKQEGPLGHRIAAVAEQISAILLT